MNFMDIQNIIKGKLKLKGDERSEMALIKSSINQAYVAFSEIDCVLIEKDYTLLEISSILTLPVDFLVYHSIYITMVNEFLVETIYKIPRHYLEINSNKLLIRDDVVIAAPGVTKIKLVYGSKPTDLIASGDVPLINATYHVGLVYYALFLITDDKKYYELYMNIYNSIPRDNYVANYSNIIDVL